MTVEFDAHLPPAPPTCPPTIVNEAHAYDGAETWVLRATTAVVCSAG